MVSLVELMQNVGLLGIMLRVYVCLDTPETHSLLVRLLLKMRLLPDVIWTLIVGGKKLV
jgi:hypothetical protein